MAPNNCCDMRSALHQLALVIFRVTVELTKSTFGFLAAPHSATFRDSVPTIRADVLIPQFEEVFLLGLLHISSTFPLGSAPFKGLEAVKDSLHAPVVCIRTFGRALQPQKSIRIIPNLRYSQLPRRGPSGVRSFSPPDPSHENASTNRSNPVKNIAGGKGMIAEVGRRRSLRGCVVGRSA